MEKDKIFRYNDQSERYHSMNKIYILATTILWLQFIIQCHLVSVMYLKWLDF